IAGFPLTFARNGSKLRDMQSDAEGIASLEIPDPPKPKDSLSDADAEWRWEERRHRVLILGEHDGNFVISDRYYYGDNASEPRIYIETDKPVYRPGQTVNYRAIARKLSDDGAYQNISHDTARIEIRDDRDDVVRRDTSIL